MPNAADAARSTAAAINAPVIRRLQDELRAALAAVVPASSAYAIVDFPNHANIGDSAIYAGEMVLCREHFGRDPVLVTEAWDHDLEAVARLPADVVLLCHGGGNFGDLYPRHQKFREALVARFPERKIVFLPQSVHFESEARLEAAARVLGAHPDLVIMVRDEPSRDIIEQRIGARVMLVPDAAFMLGAILPPRTAEVAVLGLIRLDKEAVALDRGLALNPSVKVDWPAEDARPTLLERLPHHVRKRLPAAWQGRRPVTPAAYAALAEARLRRGLALLARGEVVLTDRLHAHILAVLLGIPHLVLDNSYGKIARFISAWTADASFARA